MAVKWAVANGDWSNGATWNDGTIPQAGDYVYASGKTIQIGTGVNIGNGTLSTEICPNTGISGGSFNSGKTSLNITANLKGYNGVYVIWSVQDSMSGNVSITGNIDDYGISLQGGPAYILSITGNVSGTFYQSRYGANIAKTVNIVGNVANGARIQTNTDSFNVSVVGNVDLGVNFCSNISLLNRLTINGITRFIDNYIMTRPLTTSGVIDLTQTDLTYIPTTSSITFAGQTTIVADYPSENVVKEGVRYGVGLVGTYQQPPETVVLEGFVYDNGDKIGSLENQNIVGCVTPEDVRKDVPLVGMGVVGSLVVPSVDDVREGVVFDNGSVGTLIVEGGGDRLRIADFGYYTNAQSDTYIVDLTELDKPKFAVAEERVLIEMFPDLDFDNIPDKYFDDLFVKYLKYRLIVEYYRTAGINSTFTPSEPTTEIVNYRNVNCEIWMNIANTYLKAWGEKYPNSIKKQRILL